MPVSTRRTTLGVVNFNRSRGSLPSTNNQNKNKLANGKMKKKTARSRMSMAPRVGGGTISFSNQSDEKENNGKTGSGRTPTPKTNAGTQPTTPSRRKSMGHGLTQSQINPSNATIGTDPRPINEKQYQTKCIKTIMQYLVSHNYEYPVSHKILSRPSSKDFNQIVTFLLRRVDPTFNDSSSKNSMKFEDEVAFAFKGLGYPFPISKTALVAAGSIHTWPTLLAALNWLIELLSGMSKISVDDFDDDDDILSTTSKEEQHDDQDQNEVDAPFGNLDTMLVKTEKRFFRYLASSYEAFLSTNDEEYDILEEKFLDDFERDNMKIEKEIERITDYNALIVEEIDYYSRNSLSLPEMEKKREALCNDLEKFHNLVNKFKEHKAALQHKVNDSDIEHKKNQDEVEEVKKNLEKLKKTIQTQEFSVEDVRKMENERKRMKDIMEQSGKNKQSSQKRVWELEMELSNHFKELNGVVQKYNDAVERLLKEGYFYVSVSTNFVDDPDQKKFLGVDVKNKVLPTLSKLKSDYAKKTLQEQRNYDELTSQVEACKKSISELLASVKIRQEECTKIENTMKAEEKENETKIATTHKQVKELESKISALSDPIALEASIERFQTQLVQLTTRRQQLRYDGVEMKESVQKEINDALSIIADHEEYVQTKLADLCEYVNTRTMTLDVDFTIDSESSTLSPHS